MAGSSDESGWVLSVAGVGCALVVLALLAGVGWFAWEIVSFDVPAP